MNGVRPSLFSTLDVPPLSPNSGTPTTIIAAVQHETRALCRNIGGSPVFFAMESSSLANQSSVSNTYRLDPGQSDVFVISRDLGLYAASQGAGGRVCVNISSSFEGPGFGA